MYGDAADLFVLVAAFGIGATAPQVAPMSRSRLVTIISERMPEHVRARTLSATMAYESAADETVFVFGPFIVGVLASLIAPWAPLVIAAALTVVFVGAFALHPSGRHVSHHRDARGRAPSRAVELLRPDLLVVVLGILGIGIFFGTMLTSLTSFMADRGVAEQAGLLYGVMGVGSAIMGIGIGPTLVTQFSLGAARSPLGRTATVMTMLGSGVIVGQALGATAAGEIAESIGTSAALLLPMAAAATAFVAGVLNGYLGHRRPRSR
ncbi:MFS transporter [Microbacterium sp. AK031]|uniref:MFS transporter n=1 Tax=Microbacterium sp. AK031 TaxID=2723076 RepID=UPI00286E0D80|nr:MFS transporter [Microbacterium sp. AK031]MCS3842336.1 MFS family permease [Microbacterium sp. AK031]